MARTGSYCSLTSHTRTCQSHSGNALVGQVATTKSEGAACCIARLAGSLRLAGTVLGRILRLAVARLLIVRFKKQKNGGAAGASK